MEDLDNPQLPVYAIVQFARLRFSHYNYKGYDSLSHGHKYCRKHHVKGAWGHSLVQGEVGLIIMPESVGTSMKRCFQQPCYSP